MDGRYVAHAVRPEVVGEQGHAGSPVLHAVSHSYISPLAKAVRSLCVVTLHKIIMEETALFLRLHLPCRLLQRYNSHGSMRCLSRP